MDEPVEAEPLDVIEPDGDVRLSQIQWIGLSGALVAFVGLFTPLYGMLTFRITMASLGWPAVVIGVVSVAAAWFIVRRNGALALVSGLVALGVALYLLIRTEFDKASMNDRFPSTDTGTDWSAPLPNGVNDMVDAVIAPQWGWAVLLLGISATLVSSLAIMRSGQRRSAR
jgi:hypothetical protein